MNESTNDVAFKGYLVKSPPSTSRFGKWKQRYFILYGTTKQLYYYDDHDKSKLKGTIDLNRCWKISSNVRHKKYSHIFSVSTPDRQYMLVAGSEQQKRAWINALTVVCQQQCPTRHSRSDISTVLSSNNTKSTEQESFSNPGFRASHATIDTRNSQFSASYSYIDVESDNDEDQVEIETPIPTIQISQPIEESQSYTTRHDDNSAAKKQSFPIQISITYQSQPMTLYIHPLEPLQILDEDQEPIESIDLSMISEYTQDDQDFIIMYKNSTEPATQSVLEFTLNDQDIDLFDIFDEHVASQHYSTTNPAYTAATQTIAEISLSVSGDPRLKRETVVDSYNTMEYLAQIAEQCHDNCDDEADVDDDDDVDHLPQNDNDSGIIHVEIDPIRTQALAKTLRERSGSSTARPTRLNRVTRHDVSFATSMLGSMMINSDEESRSRSSSMETTKPRSISQPPQPTWGFGDEDIVLIPGYKMEDKHSTLRGEKALRLSSQTENQANDDFQLPQQKSQKMSYENITISTA